MGRWAQRRHRGGGGQPSLPVAVLFLEATGFDNLQWSWTDTDPEAWVIESADDPGGPWTFDSSVPGGDRNEAGVDNTKFFHVYGTVGGIQSTPTSNVVNF